LNANTAIEIALRGGVIPALAALALFILIGWLWPSEIARRYRASLAFALGAYIGYVLLPSTKSLAPQQVYEWIPLLGVFAALVSGLIRADGVSRAERWTTIYIFAPIAAWLIVPRWPEMSPPWPIQWAALSLGIVMLTALLQPLSYGLAGRAFPWLLMLPAATISIVIQDRAGEAYGVPALVWAGALAGCGVAAFFARQAIDWRGLVLPYAVVIGGYAYVGSVYPTEPLWLLALAPPAPLTLWICTLPPLARLTGARAVALQAVCVAVPLAIVAARLMAPTNGAADAW
jgi:hypothetical protein